MKKNKLKQIENESRIDNLKELVNALSEFENLDEFLEHVGLVNENLKKINKNSIKLMTLHAAKGLEFDHVYLPGWEEGIFPSSRALEQNSTKSLEEERRLAYVGITRAKKRLFITFAANRQIHGLWQGSIPSRFISELPQKDLNKNFEGNLGADASSYNQIDFETVNNSSFYGPGFFRAKQEGINPINIYKQNKIKNNNSNFNVDNGQRVFHQKFGMGLVISSDGDKLNISFDKAGEKRVMASFVKVVD